MGKAKKGKKNPSADDGDSDVETTTIDHAKPASKGKKIIQESDDSDNEKPKSKAKSKKSVDEDIKEVTKTIKNVSITNKSQKKKENASSEDDSDDEPQQKPKKNKKKEEKKSAFALLEIEDADISPPEAPPSSDDETPVQKSQKKSAQDKKESTKKGKKQKRKKDDSDEDIEKVLAELEMEYSGVKKEPTPAPEPEKTEEKVDEKSKSKKKGKKEEPKTEVEKPADENEGSDNENDITIKTAAQKKKEKKEREKQKKLEAKKKEKEQENKKEPGEPKQAAKAPEKEESKASEEAKTDKEPSEEKEGEGDGTAAEGKSKKKKKGDKAEKEDKSKKGGPTKKTIAAMQEALKKAKEEEERLKREEEERERQEEERERQRLEAIRLEKEKKERKKQKEKERKERLKAEGKLLTPKQKADKARAQALLESLKAQGVEIGSAEKKPPRLGTRVKPQKLKSQMSQEAPATPSEEKKIELEIVDKKDDSPKPEDKKAESDNDSVKDAWDAESSEDEVEPAKLEPIVETPLKSQAKKPETEKKEEEDESSSEEEEDSSEGESSSEEDSEDDQMTDVQKKREAILKRLEKRREENEANKVNNPLRAAVVCVLGHVDTGKTKILDKLRRTNVQDGEAGGITQQIGATNVPIENIKEQTRHVKGVNEIAFKLPGLLIIDTPGHESFSNLRSRGSSLCDIAILVVDIMHGLEPQTIESINLLKQKKTPFIVALNKIDRLYDWQSAQRKDVRDILRLQQQNTQLEFEKRSKDVMLQFAEQGLNAALFYENPDARTYVSLVPTSAVTGEGMGNLLALIVQACEGPLHRRLVFSQQLQATVLEVKAIPGLGTTIDTILINGTLREGDTIVLAGTDGPIVTQIRSLLMPQPMKELRVKNAYIEHKEVIAAQGVKIAAKELEKAIAGLNLLVAQKPDEIDVLKEEVARELKSALSSIKLSERGVYVQASTLGSLEALLEFLRTSKIPYSAIRIGPVVKRDVMKASAMLEHDSQYATILAFDVKIERDAQEMADNLGVKIFAADIIYHLFDKFTAYREELRQRKREEFKHIAVFPCKLKVLPQFVFNSRDPIVAGVMVEAGILKEGTPICVPSKEFVELGIVTSIEVNHKQVETARKGQEVCIKIEPIPGESPKMFGRHFDETDMLVSKISRASIDACKDYFRDDLIKTDWQLMVELKKLFQIL
ncbi:eukaryotic translation initiation factor 5B isoform X2 [Amyelois transitella]|uniref:eukaryotic translation initiation factor 5B isoform X2 n=1 Tax=Amyelois transitella TaxID=680683 RepID=UPI00299000CE|nr:eukaryotic translation initiation factor 5B isoform X2 [Amyelois transitella]